MTKAQTRKIQQLTPLIKAIRERCLDCSSSKFMWNNFGPSVSSTWNKRRREPACERGGHRDRKQVCGDRQADRNTRADPGDRVVR